ncbi:60S ribosomal protein L13-1-like protein [Tanacetum coccineum]
MFNQPARKTRRRNGLSTSNRYLVKGFPRPAGRLRPQVHGQTLKYNMKLREGRGFSLEELKCLSFNNSASWILPGSLAHTIVLLVKIETRTGLVKLRLTRLLTSGLHASFRGFNFWGGGLATQLPGVYKYLSGIDVESYTGNVYMADASLTYDIRSVRSRGPSVSSDQKVLFWFLEMWRKTDPRIG